MSLENLIPFLRENKLFSQFSVDELKKILPFIKTLTFQKGTWIFQEGDIGRELFIIKTGFAEVLKEEKEFGQYQELGILQAGDYFGEMAHIESEKRSASVRATETTEIIAIDLDAFEKDRTLLNLYSKLMLQIGKKVSQHLRKTGDRLIVSLQEKMRLLQSFNQISKTIVHMFIIAAIWFNIAKLIEIFPSQKAYIDPIFTLILVIFFAASVTYIIKSSGYPLSFYGLTFYKWFRYSVEGVIYSLPFIIFLFVLKWVLIHQFDLFKGIPLIPISELKENYKSHIIIAAIYIATTPIQELIARGFLQSCFKNFFQGPNRGFMAILTSNLMFQMMHTIKGFWLAIVSFAFGIYWGILFDQQKSLFGVTVSHAIIGVTALSILDFGTLFKLAS